MKKVVITGGPCSGKSSFINELEKRGFHVLREIARKVLEERKNFLFDAEEKLIRQKIIFNRQLEKEQQVVGDILFLDRGLPDTIAYCSRLLGFVPGELNCNLSKRYDFVFILDRLPFENDGLRIERGEEGAVEVHNKIIETYKDFRYSLIDVPVMPVEERADFILEHIKNDRN